MDISKEWLDKFSLCEEFYKEHHHLLINQNYIINGVNLGKWISMQRVRFKNNKLSLKQIHLLDSIGMIWDMYEVKWRKHYNICEEYYKKYGHLNIYLNVVIDDLNIGRWIGTQRTNYKNNKLSLEKIQLLDKIGMIWNVDDIKWMKFYNICEEYYKKYGHLNIGCNDVIDNLNIGRWISIQRNNYKNNKLSLEKIQLLDKVGMIWDATNILKESYNSQWMKHYNLCEEYYKKYGHLNIGYNDIIDGLNIGIWLNTQRTNYKNNKLSLEKIQLLDSIDMIWDKKMAQWMEYYNLCEEYYKKYGHLNIASDYIIDGLNIGIWIINQRTKYKNNKLSSEKIQLLDKVGMIWNTLESQWMEYYNLCVEYYKKYGHLNIDNDHIINGLNIGKWLSRQRVEYNNHNLSLERIQFLDNVGMIWDKKNAKWMKHYKLCEEYYKKYGHLNIRHEDVIDGLNMGNWISTQRVNYKKNKLSLEKIQLLNNVGIIWDASLTTGCSFPEYFVYKCLLSIYPDTTYRTLYFGKELDICIPSLKTGVEYDGSYWHSTFKSFKKDCSKNFEVSNNGFKLIRLREPKCYQMNDIANIKIYNLKKVFDSKEIIDILETEFNIKLTNIDEESIYHEYSLMIMKDLKKVS